MNEALRNKLIEQATEKIKGLLIEKSDDILGAYQQTLTIKDGDSPVNYPVNIGLKLSPCGDGIKLTASLAYSVRRSAVTEPSIVSMHPELWNGGVK